MVSLDIDISLVYQIVNFLFLMLVMNFLLYRPLRKVIKERAGKFEGLRAEASELRESLAQNESRLAALSAESTRLAMEQKNTIKKEGQDKQNEIIAQIHDEASKNLEAARLGLKSEAARAQHDLAEETVVFAREMAGKILGRSL